MLALRLLLPLLASAAAARRRRADHRHRPCLGAVHQPDGRAVPRPSADDDTLADWFGQADRNHDGILTADEMVADAERFFATLDTNHDGEIDPDELANYE